MTGRPHQQERIDMLGATESDIISHRSPDAAVSMPNAQLQAEAPGPVLPIPELGVESTARPHQQECDAQVKEVVPPLSFRSDATAFSTSQEPAAPAATETQALAIVSEIMKDLMRDAQDLALFHKSITTPPAGHVLFRSKKYQIKSGKMFRALTPEQWPSP